jgi:hypothetical protein
MGRAKSSWLSMRTWRLVVGAVASLFATSACQQAASPDTGTPIAPVVTIQTTKPTASPTLMPPTTTPNITVAVSTATPESPAGGSANANVIFVRAIQASQNTWTFHVTVEHPDTGWDDYADGWDVLTPEGEIIKTWTSSPLPAAKMGSSSRNTSPR